MILLHNHILVGKGFTKHIKQYSPFPILKPAFMIIFTPKRYMQKSTPELWHQAMVVNAKAS